MEKSKDTLDKDSLVDYIEDYTHYEVEDVSVDDDGVVLDVKVDDVGDMFDYIDEEDQDMLNFNSGSLDVDFEDLADRFFVDG